MKFRELLEGTIFKDRINLLIDEAQNNWLRNLGKNDFIHSKSIENYLDRLVPDKIKRDKKIFEKGEIFLLLYAVYLHDIGRGEVGSHHEKETYNRIIGNFEKYKLKNEFEAKAVAEICYGHAKESERPIRNISDNYGIEELGKRPLNLQFLAAILRLADELDTAYTRVQGIRPDNSAEDIFRTRKLIRFIDIDTSRWIIEFQTDSSDRKDLINLQNIQIYAQQRLDEIKKILESKGLLYHQIKLNVKDFSKTQTTIQEDIVEKAILETNGDSEVKIKCILRGNKPYVASWISISNYRSRPILFLIDTGSTISILSPADAESMGIILEKLPSPSSSMTISSVGGLIPNRELGLIKEYKAKFISDNGWFELFGENIIVLKRDHGYKIPSVFGVDFLIRHGFRLNIDHVKNRVDFCIKKSVQLSALSMADKS